MNKYRILIATALFSVSLACLVFAKPKSPAQIAKIRSDCADDAAYWRTNCINNIPPNSTNRQADVDQCNDNAEGIDIECLRRGRSAGCRGQMPATTEERLCRKGRSKSHADAATGLWRNIGPARKSSLTDPAKGPWRSLVAAEKSSQPDAFS